MMGGDVQRKSSLGQQRQKKFALPSLQNVGQYKIKIKVNIFFASNNYK
jgi:hypothetical protein